MKCYSKKYSPVFRTNPVQRVKYMGDVNGTSDKCEVGTRNVQSQRRSLPIFSARNKLLEEIGRNDTVIVLGETGSGKTTQIPQYLYESRRYQPGMIAITQPRRIAAVTVAKRVANEVGVNVGNVVGYCVRFENMTSSGTKLKYMTDGMLLREALLDPLLLKYCVIILDEAHERTIHSDVLFGVVKDAQAQRMKKLCQPMKIIIMSATMDADHFSQFFNNAPVLYLEGRQYPVQIMYPKETQPDYLFSVLVTVFQLHQEKPVPGDILVFLTGQEEIDCVTRMMKDIARALTDDAPPMVVYPLYASLPTAQQLVPFQPPRLGVRRVIVSTNVAETSVTLNGIKFVVDAGFVKVRSFNPVTGLDALKVQRISKAQALQRSGRAGRESSGICYRLYTEAQFLSMAENSIPEIQRCSLSGVALQLLVMGVEDILHFDFIDRPSPEAVKSAIDNLLLLGALKSQSNGSATLTDVGRQMSLFPIDPHLAKMILASHELSCSDEIVTIIALMSVDSVTYNPTHKRDEALAARRKFNCEEGDLLTLLKIFQAYRGVNGNKQWCQENFLHFRHLKMATDIRKQLIDLCRNSGIPCRSSAHDLSVVRRCLVQGLFMNSAELQPSREYVTLSKRQTVSIHPSSCLFNTKPTHVVFSEFVQTTKTYMKGLCVVEADWLYSANPSFFKRKPMSGNHGNNSFFASTGKMSKS